MFSNITGLCKSERAGCVAFAYVLDYTVGITALVLGILALFGALPMIPPTIAYLLMGIGGTYTGIMILSTISCMANSESCS